MPVIFDQQPSETLASSFCMELNVFRFSKGLIILNAKAITAFCLSSVSPYSVSFAHGENLVWNNAFIESEFE